MSIRFFLTAILLLIGSVAAAEPGRVRLSGHGAAGQTGDQSYATLGVGAGVELIGGLEAGLDADGWFRKGGNLYTVSPNLRLLIRAPDFTPYLGVFYRHTYNTGEGKDLDSVGGRAGVSRAIGPHTAAGAGIVYEQQLHCDDTVYSSCTSVYPEANISVFF
jgi:hypothetical protein